MNTPFVIGELFAGSDGMKCEYTSNCNKRSFCVYLSEAEVKKINNAFPQYIESGLARGQEVAHFIFQEKLGTILCAEHIRERTPTLSAK